MPTKQRWVLSDAEYRERSYLGFIMDVLLYSKKLWWIMKDIYQTLEKFQGWEKFTIIYQRLEATTYFSLCATETHVQWVGGFLVQHQTHTSPMSNWSQPGAKWFVLDIELGNLDPEITPVVIPIMHSGIQHSTIIRKNRLEHNPVKCFTRPTSDITDSILNMFSQANPLRASTVRHTASPCLDQPLIVSSWSQCVPQHD